MPRDPQLASMEHQLPLQHHAAGRPVTPCFGISGYVACGGSCGPGQPLQLLRDLQLRRRGQARALLLFCGRRFFFDETTKTTQGLHPNALACCGASSHCRGKRLREVLPNPDSVFADRAALCRLFSQSIRASASRSQSRAARLASDLRVPLRRPWRSGFGPLWASLPSRAGPTRLSCPSSDSKVDLGSRMIPWSSPYRRRKGWLRP